MPTIVALVKNVPDTWSTMRLDEDFTIDREGMDNVLDEVNEFAVEQALRIRDAHPDRGFRVLAVAMGPTAADGALRKALAMGADDAWHLVDDALAGSDALGTAWALARLIGLVDDVALVVAGNASSDGGAGALPGIVAEYLQFPALTVLDSVEVVDDRVRGTRVDERGSWELNAPLPAVVSVTDRSPSPRFAGFKGLVAAKKHQIRALSLADIGVSPDHVGLAHAATAVTAATPAPARTAGKVVRGPGAAADIVSFLEAEKII